MQKGLYRAATLTLMFTWLVWTVLLLASEAGPVPGPAEPVQLPAPVPAPAPLPPSDPSGVFEKYLSTDIPPADGFDLPVGDPDGQGSYTDLATGQSHHGWYVSTRFAQWYPYGIHPGEDWNGVGGANTDLGQPVFAVATGKVVFAGPCGKNQRGVVVIQHLFYENHEKKRIRSVYIHLEDMRIRVGQMVRRRQLLGTIGKVKSGKMLAHLHLELRTDESLQPTYWPSAHRKSRAWILERYREPSAFIRSHRHLLVPHQEEHLVLVDPGTRRMRCYRHGRLTGAYPLNLDRARPNDLPKGMYFVVPDSSSETHFHRINYPNKYDAARARSNGLIPAHREAEIARAWRDRRLPAGKEPSKRKIGFRLRNGPGIPVGTMVVILPSQGSSAAVCRR